jgi:SAM-dependent methyltransferase
VSSFRPPTLTIFRSPDDTFDGARVVRVLQHVADHARVLSEMARLVRPRGIVIASEPDWGTLTVDGTDRAATREVLTALCDEHIRNGWIGRQLVGCLIRAGVEPTEVRPTTLVLRSLPVAVDILGLADVAGGATEWFADLDQTRAQWVILRVGHRVHCQRTRRVAERKESSYPASEVKG